MNGFKEQVKYILEASKVNDPYSWNKYISSRINDKKEIDKPLETTNDSYVKELDDLISKARKSGVDVLEGLILAKKIYLKHNK